MSITDSLADRAEAEQSLASKTDAQLRDDLTYWVVASHDHRQEFQDLADRQGVVRELWQESATWERMIAEEIARRRPHRSPAP